MVVAGWAVARLLADRLGSAWPAALVILTIGAGAIGWLQSEAVRSALLAGEIGRALTLNQAGWLAGLAFLRGTAHARPPISERSLGRLLTFGVPALAIPLIIGRSLPEPARSTFQDRATVEALVFVVTATLALALTRLARLGAVGGFDWRRNRTWLSLLGLVLLATAIAIPAAAVVGPTVQLGVALLLPPLMVIGIVAGMGSITRRAVGVVLAVGAAVFIVTKLALEIAPTTPNQDRHRPRQRVGLGGSGHGPGNLAARARRADRRDRAAGPDLDAPPATPTATRRRGVAGGPAHCPGSGPARAAPQVDGVGRWAAGTRSRPTRSRRTSRRSPEFAKAPELARLSSETPAGHARRLRAADAGSIDLELLAADYQLVRFGAATLTPGRGSPRGRSLATAPGAIARGGRGPRGDPPADRGERSRGRAGR